MLYSSNGIFSAYSESLINGGVPKHLPGIPAQRGKGDDRGRPRARIRHLESERLIQPAEEFAW